MVKNRDRQLAAIMFTDMVGYSALTQRDENLALELLEEHRGILRQFFPKYGGREVETIGDAFFVEFSSALEATECAISIQEELWKRNFNKVTEKHINLRIGIHLGDVVHKAKNVLGDEVNIAARIEPLAQAGGICISEDVARQVKNKISFPLKKLKKAQLKNISLPVKVYAIQLPWIKKHEESFLPGKLVWVIMALLVAIILVYVFLPGVKSLISKEAMEINVKESSKWQNSIAVLPFTDMSQKQDQEYFCDGMTDQILTNLAKLNNLKVIARTSVMKFKNTDKTIPEIANELKVENILEGSVRRSGNQLRVTAQLINAKDGSHIWAQDFDREYDELFAIQDDISTAIANKLSKELTVVEEGLLKTQRTVNLEAYEYFLKGEYVHRNKFWSSKTQKDFNESERLFLKAIELDSTYAPSYAGLVDLYNTYFNTIATGDEEKQKFLNLQEKYIAIAAKLDIESSFVNRVLGWVYSAKNDRAKQFEYLKRACEIDPNDPENNLALGISYDIIGLTNLAYQHYSRCIELDPYYAKYHYHLANLDFHLGKFTRSKVGFKKALDIEPNHSKYLSIYGWQLILMEEKSEAQLICEKHHQLYPETFPDRFLQSAWHAMNGDHKKALAVDLEPGQKLIIFLYLKLKTEALEALAEQSSKFIKEGYSRYLNMKMHPLYDFLREEAQFQKILKEHKMLYEKNLTSYGRDN